MSDLSGGPLGQVADGGAASPPSRLALNFPMIAAAGLMVLTIVAGAITVLQLYDRVDREAQANLARLSSIVSEQTSHSFQSVDLVLKEVVGRVAMNGLDKSGLQSVMADEAIYEFLAEKRSSLEQIDNLILIGADGNLANMARSWPAPTQYLGAREQFRYLRDHDKVDVFVSEPVRNKLNGAWTFYLARRINDSRGEFAGVAQAAIYLRQFSALHRSLNLGDTGSVSLVRDDGVMLVRYPEAEAAIGADGKSADRGALVPDPQGQARYVAINEVRGFPLRVSITLIKDAVLGSWRRDVVILALGAAGALASVLLLLRVLARKIRILREADMLHARQNVELAESRCLLLEAQRIGKLGHWVADASRQSAIWSPQLFEIAGLEPTETVSLETLTGLIHPDDLQDFLRARNESQLNASSMMHELRWVRPDGSIRWVRMKADPQFDESNKFRGVFGIVLDVTDLKLAEQAAKASNRALLDAVESFSHGFVLYDKEDRFVLANSRFREMYSDVADLLQPGVRYEEIVQALFRRGTYRTGDSEAEEQIAEMVRWHQGGNGFVEQRLNDGRWFRLSEHRTSDGGIAGLRTDITEFKALGAARAQRVADLEQARNDLESQKRDLLATSLALSAAKDAAEAANRAKSDFLAIMSHEIRTPLSGLVGMIDLLRETPLSQEQLRLAVMAKESSDSLLSVINDILDFSKLEAGRLEAEAIDFDIVQLVTGVTALLKAKAADKGLTLDMRVDAAAAQWLEGDPGRIRQVLLNLVSNAIKFTKEGGVQINAVQRRLSDGRVELRVEVIDSGIGIPPDIQQRLFNPFVQADTSISRRYGGSGLGLAICKQLCSMMGGTIGIDSEPERGSTFWFTVNCGEGTPHVPASPTVVVPIDYSIQVLVAEDSPIIAALIYRLLKKRGLEPHMVMDGEAAVEAVQRKRYDLVLMDVQMPGMDGISATKAIRLLNGEERSVPIIALTANALVGQRESYMAAGMNDYVTKPIQPALLFAAIDRWAANSIAPSIEQMDCDAARNDEEVV